MQLGCAEGLHEPFATVYEHLVTTTPKQDGGNVHIRPGQIIHSLEAETCILNKNRALDLSQPLLSLVIKQMNVTMN